MPNEEHPSIFELPKSVISKQVEDVQLLEDVAGRVAMVGALGLLVGEAVTGESVAEQFAHAFHSFVI